VTDRQHRTYRWKKTVASILALFFSQPSNLIGQPGGVNRFCKKSCV